MSVAHFVVRIIIYCVFMYHSVITPLRSAVVDIIMKINDYYIIKRFTHYYYVEIHSICNFFLLS